MPYSKIIFKSMTGPDDTRHMDLQAGIGQSQITIIRSTLMRICFQQLLKFSYYPRDPEIAKTQYKHGRARRTWILLALLYSWKYFMKYFLISKLFFNNDNL